MKKYSVADLTRKEFEDILPSNPIIVLPLGSLEQHGPACPMGDYKLAEAVAEAVSIKAKVLRVPTLPFGHADYFKTVPGGIALQAKAFSLVLEDMCRSYLDYGLNRILILNGHGGNRALIKSVTRQLRKGGGQIIPTINLWRSISDEAWDKAHPGLGRKAFGHGSDPIGSLNHYLNPKNINKEEKPEWNGNKTFRGFQINGVNDITHNSISVDMPFNIDDVCDTGITGGNPSGYSAQAGKLFFDNIVEFVCGFIDQYWGADRA